VTEDDRQPFSEDAALRELEDLQRAIEASRVRRKDANDAFDRFLRSFERRPAPASTPEPPPAPRPLPLPPVAAAPVFPPARSVPAALPAAPAPAPPAVPPPTPEIVATPVSAPPGQADAATLPSSPEDPVESPGIIELTPANLTPANLTPSKVDLHPREFPSERPSDLPDALDLDNWEQAPATGVGAFPEESDRRPLPASGAAFRSEPRTVPSALGMPVPSGRRIPPVALVFAALVIAAVAFFALRGNSDDAGKTDPVAAETPTAAPQPAPQPAPPVATPPPPRAEISTLRLVWIRVMVDGQKVVEREVPPNTRIPLDPASQFVVRAGDGGAVRVAIGGKDQGPVGADGRVATKAFTVPPKAGQ
jgi:hypothetical protein